MNCRKVRRYLFGYFKQELSAKEMEEIKAHLDACSGCAGEAKEVSRINLLLKSDLETLAPSPDFNQKLMARIQNLAPEKVVSEERSWWQKLLREVFPSVKLRWAVAGAVSVVVLAFAVMLTQKRPEVAPEYLSESGRERGGELMTGSEDMADSAYQDLLRRLAQGSIPREGKTFVMDNLKFSPSRGEDGAISPEDLYKRFVIDRRVGAARQGGPSKSYVMPVVSTQAASEKVGY
ncbi:MAG: zf-HC2 domain-containing protein [Candidatus Zixiibacteriota bacterium]|nr:MAG: zf-HC2 domain-containing protein [candidate division Zixibacteria bacterium]